jgi:alkyldihydroxyacetonephosphate synthase
MTSTTPMAQLHALGQRLWLDNITRELLDTGGLAAYIRDFVLDHWVLAESFETSVPWSQLETLIEKTKARIEADHQRLKLPGRPFVSARVTQIYDTGACVYFYMAYYYKGVENPTAVFHEIENGAREEILAQGGSLSHHHGIGKIREGFLPKIASPATLAWQQAAKQALDPQNVFASGNQTPPVGASTPTADAALARS